MKPRNLPDWYDLEKRFAADYWRSVWALDSDAEVIELLALGDPRIPAPVPGSAPPEWRAIDCLDFLLQLPGGE